MCHVKHSVLLKVIIILVVSACAYAQYSGGSGTAEDPYQIATAAGLILLGETPEDYDKHFVMTADIDLDPNLPGGRVFDRAVIARDTKDANFVFDGVSFAGVFDGKDYAITNLTILGGYEYLGLFGQLGVTAKISNLWLDSIEIIGAEGSVGGLAGVNDGAVLFNCHVVSKTDGHGGLGGLVGINYGNIHFCSSQGLVTGSTNCGGLVGINRGLVTSSYSASSVLGSDRDVGGLVGFNTGGGSIKKSYSTGFVNGEHSVGGLVGYNTGRVESSYSTDSVSGSYRIGGLVGAMEDGGSVISSYSAGPVSGEHDVGGLVGGKKGNILSSFWDIGTSGQATSRGGTGKTTSEMQTASIFIDAGWDFIDEANNGTHDIWKIVEGQTYPLLSWQKYGGGTGEPADLYLIYTAEHLNALGGEPNDYDKHFKLMADIDLSEYTYDRAVIAPDVNDAERGFQGTAFTGLFDGKGHSISHLTIQGAGHVGFFGQVSQVWGGTSTGIVRDLGILSCQVTASGSLVGGLAGSSSGKISNCFSTGSINGSEHVGGLVGFNDTAFLSNQEIVYSGDIDNCYTAGIVGGDNKIGGLVGTNASLRMGHIANCYSTCVVKGNGRVGGLIGRNYDYIADNFWDVQASGRKNMCGIEMLGPSGCDDSSGKTTAEMQTASTFLEAGWDFINETTNGTEDIWWIDEGKDYPRLWWEAE